MTHKIIIDATNAILGRLASYAAKQSLLGKEVIIINCDEAVITGSRKNIINHYIEYRTRGGTSLKGPFFPKNPERIVKRTIRGMLSYKQGRGRAAFKRILCYSDAPKEYADAKKIKAGKEKNTNATKLHEVSKILN